MSTVSNGVDIVENIRINKAIKNISFVQRVFSKKEIELSKKYRDKTNYFAKRFAAKEAFYKTLGTGLRNNYKFKDITVKNDKYGKPSIVINEKLKKMIYKQFRLKKFKLHLSLSDEKKYSIAFVILSKI
tara:strand:+ start:992 stop:1378 length:387 start_codon:yes stop_codon:yes gene_type:complete